MGVITRVAGTGAAGKTGDDGPATVAQLNNPAWVAVTADGGFLIADSNNNEVRKVSAAGVITRVAGTGTPGNTGDDGPATNAQLDGPAAVAVTADGGFLIADSNNNVVRKVSTAGVITRVAGTGTLGHTGDDGPATDAQLAGPLGLAVTADGGFLIADYGNSEVRKVSAAGVITRVAGITPATEPGSSEVRKVSAAGVITRVAGTSTNPGNTGDDGPATDAQLTGPIGLAVTADGGFLIADSLNNEVRKVSAAGVITRVAGTGAAGNSGDDGPATDAQLKNPGGIAVTADGGFLIADSGNNEVRKVAADP